MGRWAFLPLWGVGPSGARWDDGRRGLRCRGLRQVLPCDRLLTPSLISVFALTG